MLFALPALMQSSPERPWFNSIVYKLDADSGAAHWLAFNDSRMGRGTRHQLDEWTSAFLTAPVEETTFDPWLVTRSDTPYPALRSAAPVAALPRTAVGETAPVGQDMTRLVVARPPEAMLTRLVVRSAAPITGITLDGEALDLGGTQPLEYTFLIIGRDDEVAIHLSGTSDVAVDALDRLVVDVVALAAAAGQPVPPRPEWMAAAAASDTGEGAIVTARFD